MVTLLDGRPLAKAILKRLKKEIARLPVKPGLAAVLVGNDPASHLYVSIKERVAYELGVNFQKFSFPRTIAQDELIQAVNRLSDDESIQGILIQLPLPKGLDTQKIIQAIIPQKDVDGFLPQSGIISPTLKAIMDLLKESNIALKGKTACILVKSKEFLAYIQEAFEQKGIGIIKESANADIVISALGKPRFLPARNIKQGAIVIDVGINVREGKTIGDAAPDVEQKAGFLSPVPGGVGPLTVAHLFANLLVLAKKSRVSYNEVVT
ncbi:MAG: bifunctional 5,10-methylenetetrahydrofolate dehydrogenase/5,10-methenyltetrahydrofolate cyclohydrolase [Candidatus Portnoybacteria bacterium]|nr:bifunctional 5,10-methylenetetrahydrofolate dehydrogenase/5,10-methenyltetrahydrofolate cyclohydrolase [Candidatus Portnoybacteria bacterium]